LGKFNFLELLANFECLEGEWLINLIVHDVTFISLCGPFLVSWAGDAGSTERL